MRRFVLAKDLVIPAGTPIDIEPAGTKRTIGVEYASLVGDIGADKDSSWEWSMDLEEAIRVGLVKAL